MVTIACIQVVPFFAGVQTKMSPGRCSKSAHRRLSETMCRYSRAGCHMGLSL
jgi:hypothetical protein